MGATNKGGEIPGLNNSSEITRRTLFAGLLGLGATSVTACFGGGKTETTPGPAPTVAGELTPEASVNPNATTEAPQSSPTEETPLQKEAREREERKELLIRYINMTEGQWSALATEEKYTILGLALRVAGDIAPLELTEKDQCDKFGDVIYEADFDATSAPADAVMARFIAHRQAVLLTHETLGIARKSPNLATGFVERMANVMLPDDQNLTSPLGDPIKKAIADGKTVDVSCVPPMIMGAKDPENQPGGVVRRKIAISDYYGLTDVTIDWHPTEHGSVPVVVRQLNSGAFL